MLSERNAADLPVIRSVVNPIERYLWVTVVVLAAGIGVAIAIWSVVPEASGAVILVGTVAAAVLVIAVLRSRVLFAILGALTVGTVVADKTFAHLSVTAGTFPIYITDTALLALLVSIMLSPRLRKWAPRRGPLFAVFVPFVLWGSLLLGVSFGTYGVAALRDFALFYYVLFVPVGYVAAHDTRLSRLLLIVFGCACGVVVVKSLLFGVGQDIGYGIVRELVGQSTMYLVVALLLALSWMPRLTRKDSFVLVIVLIPVLVAIYDSQTRSAWLALLAGVASLVMLDSSWRKRIPTLIVVCFSLALLFIMLSAAFQQTDRLDSLSAAYDRLRIALLDPQADPTSQFRLDAWAETVRRLEANPVVGDGLGSPFSFQTGTLQFQVLPHNTYLTVLLKSGLIGGVCLLTILLYSYAKAVRFLFGRRIGQDCSAVLGLLAAHVSLSVYGFFFYLLESPYLAWPYWVLTGALLYLTSKTPYDSSESSHESANPPMALGVATPPITSSARPLRPASLRRA